MNYPNIKRVDFEEDYHGTTVRDPYRYLEDPDDEETKHFVTENNKLVEKFIDDQLMDHYSALLEDVLEYDKFSVPVLRGDRVFYSKQQPDQLQPILYMRKGIDGEEQQILDINELSEDGTTASMLQHYSRDGKYMTAYITKHGSDWQSIMIKNIDENKKLETLDWVNLGNVAWNQDNTGFYYTEYPDQTGLSAEKQRRDAKLLFHEIGTSQDEDLVVFNPKDDDEGPSGVTYNQGKYLVITLSNSTLPENRLLFRKQPEGEFTWIIDEYDGSLYDPIGIVNQKLYLNTSYNAPNNRIMAVDLSQPERENWSEIIPETEHVLRNGVIANNTLVLTYEENVKNVLKVYDLTGEHIRDIDFPTIGTITAGESENEAITGNPNQPHLFYGFTSFLHPMSVYHLNLEENNQTEYLAADLDADVADIEIDQKFYQSKDGTNIPIYLIHKKGLTKDSSNPTFLYGYGGFNISLLPSFSSQIYAWVKDGGLYAIANLRGGGEFGKKWHEQALLDKKQNVFDDFIAAAKYLIDEGYTATPYLGINGRSNGGLLIGASITQRPDLFGAAIPQVGVLDMLRYPVQKDAGRFWTKEYGDAIKNSEHFDFLIEYSPYHNIKEGTKYPPTLVTAAESDDRVAPMHSKKFGAALQHAQAGDAPILVRIETKAGHGYGKPKSKIIEDTALNLTFFKQILS